MNVVDTVKNAAFASAIQAALNYMDKDPETNIPKVMSIVDKAAPEGWYESQRNAIRQGIAEKVIGTACTESMGAGIQVYEKLSLQTLLLTLL